MSVKAPGYAKPRKLSEAERAQFARLGSPLIDMLGSWLNRRLSCAHCKRCTRRCEILEASALDIGLVEEDFERLVSLAPERRGEAVLRLVREHPERYHALRQCCFCGYCTATCAVHMVAPERMREWRRLFAEAGLMPIDDSKLVMVDNEWHIFSAYRAIHGIAYPEFTQLPDAADGGAGDAEAGGGVEVDGDGDVEAETGAATGAGTGAVDTLFFPGCSLASYAPELTRRIGRWLDGAGYRWAMSLECCGSPLMSAGLSERSEALRFGLLEQIRAAGITRVLTICPGCGEELAEVMGDEVDIIPLPEVLLEHLTQGERGALGGNGALGGLGQAGADSLPSGTLGQAGASALPSGALPSVTFFDSCHDRSDTRHGTAVRRLLRLCLPATRQVEMAHHGRDTLCCGAGGAVAVYDADLTRRRVWRVIDEARATEASVLVTMCPTCTYTIGQALLAVEPERGINSHNYLELVFGQAIDWPAVFAQLEAMWVGEYGPWLAATFF